MRRCVLHIGQPKTGSSAIQRSLHARADHLLAQHGIGFFTEAYQHTFLLGAFGGTTRQARVYGVQRAGPDAASQAAHFRKVLARLEHHVETSGSEVEILSCENLAQVSQETLMQLQGWLAARFDRIDVHAYLRGPFEGVNSLAQQEVRSGLTFAEVRAELDLSDEPSDIPKPIRNLLKPRQWIEPFLTVFGAENVHLRRFGRAFLTDGDAVEDFCQWSLGKTTGALGIESLRVNETLAATPVHILDSVYRQVPRHVGGIRVPYYASGLYKLVRDIPCSKRFVLPGLDAERLRQVSAADVDWLYGHTGGAIDFRNEEQPDFTPQVDWNGTMDAMALALHDVTLDREQSRAAQTLRAAFQVLDKAKAPDTETCLQQIRRAANHLHDEAALERVARRLARLGHRPEAHHVAQQLSWKSNDPEIRQRAADLMARFAPGLQE